MSEQQYQDNLLILEDCHLTLYSQDIKADFQTFEPLEKVRNFPKFLDLQNPEPVVFENAKKYINEQVQAGSIMLKGWIQFASDENQQQVDKYKILSSSMSDQNDNIYMLLFQSNYRGVQVQVFISKFEDITSLQDGEIYPKNIYVEDFDEENKMAFIAISSPNGQNFESLDCITTFKALFEEGKIKIGQFFSDIDEKRQEEPKQSPSKQGLQGQNNQLGMSNHSNQNNSLLSNLNLNQGLQNPVNNLTGMPNMNNLMGQMGNMNNMGMGMGGMGAMNNMSSMMGMGGMNNMLGMGGLNNMMGMGGMNNMMGMGNMMGMNGMMPMGGMNNMMGMGNMMGMPGMGGMNGMMGIGQQNMGRHQKVQDKAKLEEDRKLAQQQSKGIYDRIMAMGDSEIIPDDLQFDMSKKAKYFAIRSYSASNTVLAQSTDTLPLNDLHFTILARAQQTHPIVIALLYEFSETTFQGIKGCCIIKELPQEEEAQQELNIREEDQTWDKSEIRSLDKVVNVRWLFKDELKLEHIGQLKNNKNNACVFQQFEGNELDMQTGQELLRRMRNPQLCQIFKTNSLNPTQQLQTIQQVYENQKQNIQQQIEEKAKQLQQQQQQELLQQQQQQQLQLQQQQMELEKQKEQSEKPSKESAQKEKKEAKNMLEINNNNNNNNQKDQKRNQNSLHSKQNYLNYQKEQQTMFLQMKLQQELQVLQTNIMFLSSIQNMTQEQKQQYEAYAKEYESKYNELEKLSNPQKKIEQRETPKEGSGDYIYRCKYWPWCQTAQSIPEGIPDCSKNRHPYQICRFYPKCLKGNQCVNLHPNDGVYYKVALCKFRERNGKECENNMNCPIKETCSNKHDDDEKYTEKDLRCFKYPDCQKKEPKCFLIHPERKLCKDYPNCNKGVHCSRVHPCDGKYFNRAFEKEKEKTTKICSRGKYCKQDACYYLHPKDSRFKKALAKEREKNGKKCKYGRHCKNIDTCTYIHRDSSPSRDRSSYRDRSRSRSRHRVRDRSRDRSRSDYRDRDRSKDRYYKSRSRERY
ncbi:hypothetical protein PPERSA_12551 [Pseudocohnilembus persalinus]|uniref:YTH domain-containing protein n=1 Tax=Pseudocohnilembus persalinus TaxID=266149 RepID=A0A0V0Q8G0_PSEPJ|nr:hypothetical protein PPERSA_12551 [Pseudocohnilembus persalinus]|eukprot:KRW98442.1 hypothetical protein PPERSA_12551 [Pseudocohnilembus persalinus]